MQIKLVNSLAKFVPCAAHSLNLVGSNAVNHCIRAVSFFGFLGKTYSFFSASMHWWGVLMKHLKEKGKELMLNSV